MKVELQRAWGPADLGEDECDLCEQPFVVGSVVARCVDLHHGGLCPTCIEYLGRRNPQKFPSLEEYEAALEQFPQPIWPTEEELALKDPNWEYINSVMVVPRA